MKENNKKFFISCAENYVDARRKAHKNGWKFCEWKYFNSRESLAGIYAGNIHYHIILGPDIPLIELALKGFILAG